MSWLDGFFAEFQQIVFGGVRYPIRPTLDFVGDVTVADDPGNNQTIITFTNTVGPAGPPGTNGTNGKTILSGSGAPSGGLGVDGDFYIDTATEDIYGPKAAGVWPAPVSLIGPPGTPGIPFIFSASGSGTNPASRWLFPGGSETAIATTERSARLPFARSFTKMTVLSNGAGTGTGSSTYTLYVNGVSTGWAISIAIATAVGIGVTVSISATANANDRISVIQTQTGTITGGMTAPTVTLE